MKSWKTTILGLLGAIALLIPQVIAVLDDDPATQFSLAAVIAALGIGGTGIAARDNNQSSEQVGAK